MCIAYERTQVLAKKTLRRAMQKRRSQITELQRREAALKLKDVGFDFLHIDTPLVITGYAPIKTEFDCLPLLKKLESAGHDIALPVIEVQGEELSFRSWNTDQPLIEGAYGIPAPSAENSTLDPHILCVPLLAFDKQGYRLGYGGGYYDRTLRSLRARRSILAIGIAFEFQGMEVVPHDEFDERLNWVLTPSGPIKVMG